MHAKTDTVKQRHNVPAARTEIGRWEVPMNLAVLCANAPVLAQTTPEANRNMLSILPAHVSHAAKPKLLQPVGNVQNRL